MNDFVLICLDEIDAVGETWIEQNSFGDIYEEIKKEVCSELDSRGISYEVKELGNKFLVSKN